MRKVHLNTKLIASLQKVLRMSNPEIEKESGLSDSTWRRINKAPLRITVQQLLQLSNGLSIPVRRFFVPEGTGYVGTREDYIITEGFQKCGYDSEAVRNVMGRDGGITQKDAGHAVSLSYTRAVTSLLSVSRLPVTRLLDFCEAFYLNPFDFLTDMNPENPALLGRKRRQPDSAAVIARRIELMTRGEMAQLRSDIDALRREMDSVTANYADLLERFDALTKAQSSLANRIGVKIDNVTNNYIAMAVEPETGNR